MKPKLHLTVAVVIVFAVLWLPLFLACTVYPWGKAIELVAEGYPRPAMSTAGVWTSFGCAFTGLLLFVGAGVNLFWALKRCGIVKPL